MDIGDKSKGFGKFHLVCQDIVMNVQEKGGKSYFEHRVNFKFEICKEIVFYMCTDRPETLFNHQSPQINL